MEREELERLEIGVAEREHPPYGFVAQEGVGCAAGQPLCSQESPPLLPEQIFAVALVAHGFCLADYPRSVRQGRGGAVHFAAFPVPFVAPGA